MPYKPIDPTPNHVAPEPFVGQVRKDALGCDFHVLDYRLDPVEGGPFFELRYLAGGERSADETQWLKKHALVTCSTYVSGPIEWNKAAVFDYRLVRVRERLAKGMTTLDIDTAIRMLMKLLALCPTNEDTLLCGRHPYEFNVDDMLALVKMCGIYAQAREETGGARCVEIAFDESPPSLGTGHVAEIAELMMDGKFGFSVRPEDLAKRWWLDVGQVHDLANEASKRVVKRKKFDQIQLYKRMVQEYEAEQVPSEPSAKPRFAGQHITLDGQLGTVGDVSRGPIVGLTAEQGSALVYELAGLMDTPRTVLEYLELLIEPPARIDFTPTRVQIEQGLMRAGAICPASRWGSPTAFGRDLAEQISPMVRSEMSRPLRSAAGKDDVAPKPEAVVNRSLWAWRSLRQMMATIAHTTITVTARERQGCKNEGAPFTLSAFGDLEYAVGTRTPNGQRPASWSVRLPLPEWHNLIAFLGDGFDTMLCDAVVTWTIPGMAAWNDMIDGIYVDGSVRTARDGDVFVELGGLANAVKPGGILCASEVKAIADRVAAMPPEHDPMDAGSDVAGEVRPRESAWEPFIAMGKAVVPSSEAAGEPLLPGSAPLDILADSPTPPTAVRLFEFGENDTWNGVTVFFDAEAAKVCMQAFATLGSRPPSAVGGHLPIEYEPGPDAPRGHAGFCDLEVRDTGLWATGISLRPEAIERYREGARFAPAFDLDGTKPGGARPTVIFCLLLKAVTTTAAAPSELKQIPRRAARIATIKGLMSAGLWDATASLAKLAKKWGVSMLDVDDCAREAAGNTMNFLQDPPNDTLPATWEPAETASRSTPDRLVPLVALVDAERRLLLETGETDLAAAVDHVLRWRSLAVDLQREEHERLTRAYHKATGRTVVLAGGFQPGEPLTLDGLAYEMMRPIDKASLKHSGSAGEVIFDLLHADWAARGKPISPVPYPEVPRRS